MSKDKSSVLASAHCDSYFLGDKYISIAEFFFENKWRLLSDIEIGMKGLRSAIIKNINLIILCHLHDLDHPLFDCPFCENYTFV